MDFATTDQIIDINPFDIEGNSIDQKEKIPKVISNGASAVAYVMKQNPLIVESAVKAVQENNPQISENELEDILIDYFEEEISQVLSQITLHTANYFMTKRRFLFNRVKKRNRNNLEAKERMKISMVNLIHELQRSSTNHYEIINDSLLTIEKHYNLWNNDFTSEYDPFYNENFLQDPWTSRLGNTFSKNDPQPKIDIMHISGIVNSLIEKDELYNDLNKDNIIKTTYNLLNKIPPEENISDDELKDRIEKLMLIESMSNILSDLTPDERQEFDNATKRGKFF